ncbi:MAG: ATP-binding protein, partial [Brevinematia bacterium]
MVKLSKIKKIWNFLDGKTKLVLVVFVFLFVLSIFQVVLGFFLGVLYSFEGVVLFFISAGAIYFILKISNGMYFAVEVVKKLNRDYYPFSSMEEIPNFILKNFFIMGRELKKLASFKDILLRSIYEIDEVGVIVLDKERNIIAYSKFVEKIFSISDDYKGKKIYSLFSLLPHKIDVLKESDSLEFEVPLGGDVKLLKLYLRSFEHVTLIYFFDITDFRKLEEFNELSLSIFSHELNTPLTNLSLSIENILMSKEYSEEILNIAISNIRRISNTISNITSLFNIYSKKVFLNNELFDIRLMVDNIINVLYPVYKSKNLVFNISYSGDEEVFYDKNKLELILFNLLDNAMKFSPSNGEIDIVVSNLDHFKVSISNRVVDFHTDDLDKIFEKFYRGRNSLGYKGSGLG